MVRRAAEEVAGGLTGGSLASQGGEHLNGAGRYTAKETVLFLIAVHPVGIGRYVQRSVPTNLVLQGTTVAISLGGGQAATRISGRSATSTTTNYGLPFIALLPRGRFH